MIGIDIGSKSIKIIEAEKESGKWTLKSSGLVGYAGLAPEKMVDDKDFIAIANIIQNMAKQIKLTSKEVNISLPEQLVFTRVIKFPDLTDEEIVAAVKWEAEQYIPIPIAEAVIEHIVLEKVGKNSETLVLLVAVSKSIVEKYVKIINLAGLTPVFCETELIATVRSLAPETGTNLILDFGATSTDMAIVKNSKLAFSRSIPIAGEAFTRAVSQGLGISVAQAEEYKKTYGLSNDKLEGKVRSVLEPVFMSVVEEIKKAIGFYVSEDKGEAPSSIFITGGSSLISEIVPFLANSTGIETSVGNPFLKLNIDNQTLKNLSPYIPYYAGSVGLAIRED